jgi:nitric oxide synthase-interacting protein
MSRHSKNNNTRGFFTYEERVKLDYGTKRRRIGRDSLLNLLDCFICLSRVRDPWVCSKGHLSCKECLLNSLLSQNTKVVPTDSKVLENTTDTSKITEFIKTQKSITLKSNEVETVQERKKSSFWVPQETPETKILKKVSEKKKILCYFEKEGHETSLKKSFKVCFQEKDQSFSCFTCGKTFTNSSIVKVLKKCGHAYCKECILVLDGSCVVNDCTTPGFTEKDLIEIKSQGTGFMAKGDVVIEKAGEAFQ